LLTEDGGFSTTVTELGFTTVSEFATEKERSIRPSFLPLNYRGPIGKVFVEPPDTHFVNQQPIISRSDGATESERYLQKLCERSFLRFWSYPGVYRDQGHAGTGKGDGKEICDLLVVFDDHVIIFSDKECEFPRIDNLTLAWSRWFRRAVQASAAQMWGAERWIRENPTRLFLDRACTKRFPLGIPDVKRAKFHRILIAHGASKRCKQELGGSGSLIVNTDLCGDDHLAPREEGGMPFAIGHLDRQKGYIHVFDDTTLDIILSTLDTISDLVQYLSKKERFLCSDRSVYAGGEEELLAFYLKRTDKNDEHDFMVSSEYDSVVLEEGIWEDFARSPQRLAQIKADRVSYLWDTLIERFTGHIFAGTMHYTTATDLREHNELLRWLARESRIRRRLLASALLELLEKTAPGTRGTRIVLPSSPGDPHYVFLLLPPNEEIPFSTEYEDYRVVRRNMLEACCMVAKLRFPTAEHIVGMATESGLFSDKSEDCIYLDVSEWTEEQQAEAQSLQRDLGLLTKLDRFEMKVKEYPDLPGSKTSYMRKPSPNPRNKPCPCGSGLKYKRCCGR